MRSLVPSPFPSSEIYRTLPVREEILRALLNADLIGFHTFDYARHFLSCCSRMLGLEYESKRGYIGLDYYGRTVGIKISPVGVDMGRLTTTLQLSDTEWRLGELKAEYQGKTVILGVDDMDIFKGLSEYCTPCDNHRGNCSAIPPVTIMVRCSL